jgi:hypothetical protein
MQTQTDLQDLVDRADAAIGEDATIFDNDARGRALRELITLREDLFWSVQMGEDDAVIEQDREFLRAACWEIIEQFED